MEQILEAFDMLDVVLAVFGALVVAMWFGRGKGPWSILSGALIGGFIKPAIYLAIASGLIFAAAQPVEIKQTLEQQDKTLNFWTK